MTRHPARVQLRVQGLVQGVYFRASTQAEARRLGLTGWVRNEPDGSVAAVAEGPRDTLEKFVQWCHHGPATARVECVDVDWAEPEGEFEGFVVKR
jgi:acylphosphatase